MSEHGVNRLPVIKGDDLVGIVTRTDLVKAFIRSDEEIREEIEEDLFRRTFWLGAPRWSSSRSRAAPFASPETSRPAVRPSCWSDSALVCQV